MSTLVGAHTHEGGAELTAPDDRTHRVRTLLMVGGAYLLVSVFVWWHVWVHDPVTTTTCGCGDASLFTWFLAWPAHAIAHGLDPFYSTALFSPRGFNLLANTSVLGVGTVLAPVTWAFGPVATLNVASTLSPALSGLALFVLLRRWVSWTPAAFVGGLFYGFSPFVLSSLSNAHLMSGVAIVPPLFVAGLDEILVRQERRPVGVGIGVGILIALQFFIGTEALVVMVMIGSIGVAVVIVYAWAFRRVVFRRHLRFAAVAMAVSAGTAIVLLAYPVWYALAGPAHYSGVVWPDFGLSFRGIAPSGLVHAPSPTSGLYGMTSNARVGGYQGAPLSDQYFGFGVVAVLAFGFIAWRRDLRLWLFAVTASLSAILAVGLDRGGWTPWRMFAGLPLLENIIPARFLIVTYLSVAVMLGLIIDHAYVAAGKWAGPVSGPSAPRMGAQGPGIFAGALVAALALVPVFVYLAPGLPLTTRPVVLPTWFRTVAPHLRGHQVLLVFPNPLAALASPMTWQAVNDMHYSMVGGQGPSELSSRAGPERAGQAVIARVSYAFGFAQTVTSADIASVGRALHGWGVTMVVIPDQPGLPAYDQPQSVALAAALVTAATGERPVLQARAWVWSGVGRTHPSTIPTSVAFARCTSNRASNAVATIDATTRCLTGRR